MLKDGGHYDEARQSYDAARSLHPDDADIYLQLGHLAKLQGQGQEAIAFYRRSSALDPARPDAAEELARVGAGAWIVDWLTPVAAGGPGASRPLAFMSADRERLVLERLMVSFENRPR